MDPIPEPESASKGPTPGGTGTDRNRRFRTGVGSSSRSSRRERAQPYNTTDTDAQYFISGKVDALSFDGRLDLQAYTDWQLAMDHYFHWHDMFESRKIRFAMMKLTGKAGQY